MKPLVILMAFLSVNTAKDVPLIQQKRNQRSIRCGTVVLEKGRGMGEQEVLTSGAYAPELVVYIKQ